GPAEELVDRDPERLGLEVEQRVLDRADRLLRDAARRLATDGVEERDQCLVGARVASDELRREPVDDRGHARAPEGLVVLAPADEPVVGRDLEEVEVALTGVRVQGLEPGDFHGGHYSAGGASGTGTSCAGNRRLAWGRKGSRAGPVRRPRAGPVLCAASRCASRHTTGTPCCSATPKRAPGTTPSVSRL